MWFFPHFAVVKDSKTTPVRVVYDGKARYQGHSLSDYLAKGENINCILFEVALRFREKEVGVIADISKISKKDPAGGCSVSSVCIQGESEHTQCRSTSSEPSRLETSLLQPPPSSPSDML